MIVSYLLALLLAQDPQSVRSAMQASLDQQRASVQKQAQSMGVSIPWSAPPVPAPFADCDPVPQPELSKMIDDAAQKTGVDKALVLEVARQESGFKPCAVSVKGAQGLMQLMPETQAQFSVNDPFDPKQSLEGGTKLLKQLLDRYSGDVQKALAAYNAGASRVDQSGGVPEIPETQKYVLSILGRFLR
jgi:soluble lytic murein transglycosylase-like protein